MDRTAVYRSTLRHFFAPVADLLYEDESVTEVLINGPDRIYFERGGRLYETDRRFESAAALDAAIRNLAEYVHAIIPPASRVGVCVSIRKFFRSNTTLEWLVGKGSVSPEAAEYMAVMVKAKRNLIVSGGTGSGKTSLLNALSAAIPDEERVVVIEDSAELRLIQPHTVYLEARPADPKGHGAVTIRDLFVDSLRMRPDRIIVGEVRRGEALDMIQSMLSGHDGALGTVHASSPVHALARLETLCMMNDVGLPVHVARTQVASAIHVIVQVARMADNSRRVVQIAEVAGLGEKRPYRVRPIYEFQITGRDPDGRVLGGLEWTGKPSLFRRDIEMSGPAIAAVNQTAKLFAPPARPDADAATPWVR